MFIPKHPRYRRFWPIPNIPYVLITRLKSFAKFRRKGTLLGTNFNHFNRASISLEELFSTSWLLWVGWVSYREAHVEAPWKHWQKLQAQCLTEPSIFLLSWFFFPGHHRQPSRLTLDQNYFACLYFLMFSPCFHHVFTMFSPCFRNHLPAPNHLRAWHSIHRISYEEVVLPSPCHWDCCAKTAVTAFA